MLNAGFRQTMRLAAFAVALLSLPAGAAELAARAEYMVTMGGTHVANARVNLNDNGSIYSLVLDAKITGLAQLVASGTAKATSSGSSGATGLKAQKFDIVTRASGEEFTAAVTYAGGSVDSFKVAPPIVNNIDRVAIERKHLVAANDMLAPFVLKGPALDKQLCSRQMPIFTGVERFNLTLKYVKDDTATSKRTGYQGPLVLCSMHYTPISGHYTTNEITTYLARNERILVWYAPLKTPGYYIPYRALITTEAGDLSVVLTDLSE
ncbi:DUF3108 domain-containing protein [Devosia sp. A16]|uniref:DUF3108 domain-containing protein n=1 Tax=Devosia sp. A16 TaxID=1736675 RepID=UPI000A83515C|nr:DUF3108 domain-containing protein [Devosia sp. A16]